MFWARRKDQAEESKDHVINFIGSEDSFYQYEVRVKTGMYPYSGNHVFDILEFCLIGRASHRVPGLISTNVNFFM